MTVQGGTASDKESSPIALHMIAFGTGLTFGSDEGWVVVDKS